jgi:phage protein D
MTSAGAPQFVPDYAVQINDADIPAALRASITSVVFDDGIDVSNRVEIKIANPNLQWLQDHIEGLGFDPATGVNNGPVKTPGISNSGLFDMENKLVLSLGYADSGVTQVFEGEITGLDLSFPAGGMPTVTLVAHDYLNRLSQGSYGRGFGPLPDFIIAAILAGENLLLPLIDPTIIGASTAISVVNVIFNGSGRKQKAQSDLKVMQEIADAYGADFWVDGNTFYMSRFFKEYSPSVTLTWGESLLEFAPRISTVGQVAGVGAKFVLREIPFSLMVVVSWNFDTQTLSVLVLPSATTAYLKSFIGPVITYIKRPISSPADIGDSALFLTSKLRDIINNRLTGSASAIGDPSIRAGIMIELDNLGPDFSGVYRVRSTNHTIDSGGYRTTFEVRKEIVP